MRLVLVAGARPNFMKIAPILRAIEEHKGLIEATLVHTGQHYDAAMSDVFFEQLGIREPDVHLQVGSGTHGDQTGRLMIAFENFLLALATPPDGVLVVGDVNSTVAATLVATKLGIRVAHVEAGLRSLDRAMPEEINRLVTDAIADLLLVSEPDGLRNLAQEGVCESKVKYVGNVMIDSLVHQLANARALQTPKRFGLDHRDFAVVTLHRPSNVDDRGRLEEIVAFLQKVGSRLPTLFPVHPRTHTKLVEFGLRESLASTSGITLTDPLGYRELLDLMQACKLVITDSGGVQEETTYLGIPCITLRTSTERPVTASVGTNTVVGHDMKLAWQVIQDILAGRAKAGAAVDGWDGRAGERIVAEILAAWGSAG